jgi:hypothetical protein
VCVCVCVSVSVSVCVCVFFFGILLATKASCFGLVILFQLAYINYIWRDLFACMHIMYFDHIHPLDYPIFFILLAYCCCTGRYIVTFTKVLAICLSKIHPLQHSLFSLLSPSLNSFNRSHFSISYISIKYFHYIHHPSHFPYVLPNWFIPSIFLLSTLAP